MIFSAFQNIENKFNSAIKVSKFYLLKKYPKFLHVPTSRPRTPFERHCCYTANLYLLNVFSVNDTCYMYKSKLSVTIIILDFSESTMTSRLNVYSTRRHPS